jgi:Ni/Fe-hydrogenase subunit HybB-like protein
MNKAWERSVPVFNVPLWTRSLFVLCALGIVGCVLALYREIFGLGVASGASDAYAWGIWKTFNVMAMTGLGSGGFAIGIATWLFGRHRLHVVMRTAVLTSFLVYASGLTVLGVDLGRPWNFFWIVLPWQWNVHSPMLEIGFCMPFYTALPLLLENLPPVFEGIHDRIPELQCLTKFGEGLIKRFYPWILGLAFLAPAMHQSSLGALMLLAGPEVDALWQTPWLPLLYVWAASFMGVAFVTIVLLVCHLVWDQSIDMDVLDEMGRITAWMMAAWLGFRLIDLALRGSLPLAFEKNMPGALFWVETLTLLAASALLFRGAKKHSARLAFQGSLLAALGGLLYRFDPTTLAYQPRAAAFYFPTAIELLIALGFVSLAVAGFSLLAKLLPILPADTWHWYAMESVRWTRPITRYDEVNREEFVAAD